MNMETEICGIKLKNPLILASGILGVTASSLANVAESGAGAVTTKSIGPQKRTGHSAPVIITTKNYMMNAVGLSNPGIDDSIEELKEMIKQSKSPIIISIFAGTIEEFGMVAKKVSTINPQFIEVNISCPNVKDDFGKPFAAEPESAAAVTRIVKENVKGIPIIIKLSPTASNVGQIAKACEKAGANAINMGNTGGPGMAIDIRTARPILTNKTGGLSGPGLKPLAVRCVYDVYKNVKIPIIGTGGVTCGEDAIEMIMAGASAIGIGTAVYYEGINVFKKISDEIVEFMKKEGYKSIAQMVGIAHGKENGRCDSCAIKN
jgi:dihydroorotate dehydrogenase (NAD+) catalytic subunit